MHRKLLNQYFKTDGWVTPTIGQKSVDNSNTPSYNKDIGTTTYDLEMRGKMTTNKNCVMQATVQGKALTRA